MSSTESFQLTHENNNKAVLLFHGMTGEPLEMKQYAKYLHKAGFDVHCACLPGHGGTMEDLKKVTWQDWSKFALEQFDEVKKTYSEVYLAGLCMGAVLAVNVAEERDNVAGIAALSTTLFLDGWKMPWYKFLFPLGLYTLLKYFYDFPETDPYGIKNEKIRKRVSSRLHGSDDAFDYFPMTCALELLRLSKHARKNIKKVKAPTLIVHAQEDDLTSVKSAKCVYKGISSEKKEMVILNNSYHLIVIDNEKEFVAKKSIEFFNSVSKYAPVTEEKQSDEDLAPNNT